MSAGLLGLYHGLPYPLRSFVATCRGWQLRLRRYGPATDQLSAAATLRERWDSARQEEWQQERLRLMLQRAATQVPYYRDQWRGRSDWNALDSWPVLRKETLRRNKHAFLADDCAVSGLHFDATSGTTGTPLMIGASTATLREWYALVEARWRSWAGVTRHDRWGMLGGQLVAPFEQTKPPFWVWNGGMHQLYLSSYHLKPANVASYLRALNEHKIEYLWGYASALSALASQALMLGLKAPQLRCAISNAEPLFAHQRATIAQVFGCRVCDTYGMAEMVAAASECEAGNLHLWPEAGIVEVLEDDSDKSVPAGVSGRLVCTGLVNREMPLIRYELGDRGALAPARETCACGRTMRILSEIEGRSDDVLFSADGRRIGRLDPVFKGDLPIQEAQIVQESLQRIRVLIVPTGEFLPAHAEDIKRRLRERVGVMEVIVESRAQLARTSNGKLRAVVCALSPDERASVAGR